MTDCPSCNTNNADEAAFCKSCGRPLAAAPAAGSEVVVEEVVAVETVVVEPAVVAEPAASAEPAPAEVAQPAAQPVAQPAPYNAAQQQYAAPQTQAQPAYQQPTQPFAQQPSAYAPVQPTNGKATASMVLGIVSLAIFTFSCSALFPISLITSIVGTVIGVMSRKQGNDSKGTAGIVMSIIALVGSLALLVLSILVIVGLTDLANNYSRDELYRMFDI
jgi:hypothetical protein